MIVQQSRQGTDSLCGVHSQLAEESGDLHMTGCVPSSPDSSWSSSELTPNPCSKQACRARLLQHGIRVVSTASGAPHAAQNQGNLNSQWRTSCSTASLLLPLLFLADIREPEMPPLLTPACAIALRRMPFGSRLLRAFSATLQSLGEQGQHILSQ